VPLVRDGAAVSNAPSRRASRTLGAIRAFGLSRAGLITGFIAVHLATVLALLPVILDGGTEGDLPLYRRWAMDALAGYWPVIDFPWVYPAGALIPIVGAMLAGPALYQLTWLTLTAGANLIGIWVLTRGFRLRAAYPAAWYWLLTIVLLAPVSMLRLEGIAAPLTIAALILIARRPHVAGALIALATWIKVWPAALAAAAVTVSSRRWRIALGGILLSAGIITAAVLAGAGRDILSFLTVQSDRAIQLEAVIATPWVWGAVTEAPGTFIYQNTALATREIAGPGSRIAASAIDIAMVVAFALIAIVLLTARRRLSIARLSAAAHRRAELRLVVLGAFALTAALIVCNKVGSPQYMLWIAPIITVGLLVDRRRWIAVAWVMAGISLATSLIFPILYMPLVDGDPWAAAVLTVRNAGLIALFAWSCLELSRCAKDPAWLVAAQRRESGRQSTTAFVERSTREPAARTETTSPS